MLGKEWINRVHFGDCVASLARMPEGFVNTCVTSPPYYGLRDYGTGKWVGGDPAHDHMKEVGTRVVGRNDGDRYGESDTFTGQKKTANSTRPQTKTARAEQMNPRTSPTLSDQRDVAQHEAHDAQKLKRVAVCSCGAVYEDHQIGLEDTPDAYIARLVEVFRGVRRVLRDDGTLWVNIGDSYAGNASHGGKDSSTLGGGVQTNIGKGIGFAGNEKLPTKRGTNIKPKDLIGIPWMLAFALRADGWYLRNDIIWHKTSVMPESIQDRCTKAHEYVFLLAKSERYYFDADAIKEPAITAGMPVMSGGSGNGTKNRAAATPGRAAPSGNERPGVSRITGELRNKRDVWTVNPRPYNGAHFAVYPEELIEPCILAGCPPAVCAKCGEPVKNDSEAKLRGMQKDVPTGTTQPEVLRQGLFDDLHSEEPEEQSRMVQNDEGLHTRPSSEPSRRVRNRLCDGTQAGDGTEDRTSLTSDRSSAPSERHQRRQPTGESGTADKEAARRTSKAAAQTDSVSALSGNDRTVRTCPCCKADLSLPGATRPGVVLDCFMGSGTTAAVAARLERYWVGCELNEQYRGLQLERTGRTWLADEDGEAPARNRVRLTAQGPRVRL